MRRRLGRWLIRPVVWQYAFVDWVAGEDTLAEYQAELEVARELEVVV